MKKICFLVLLANLALNTFGQNVGIGTATPLQKLDVAGNVYIRDNLGIGTSTIGFPMSFPNATGDKISLWGSSGNHFGFGIGPSLLQIHVNDPSSHIGFGYGNSAAFTEWVRIAGNGNLGIGTGSPNAPLQLGNALQNRKIVLYESANNDNEFFGFGINGGVLRYQVPSTTTNHVFYAGAFALGSNELMRITGTGNVGLGINSPQNKMDINSGAARTGSHPTGLSLYVTGASSSAGNGVEFRHDNGSQGIGFGFNTIYATGASDNQDLGMAARGPAGNLIFSTNSSEVMRIAGNGNVGIGSASPHASLQFSNNTSQNRKIVLYENADNDHTFLGFGVNGTTLRYQTFSTGGSHVFYRSSSISSSVELMRINGDGNVSIGGITVPQEKLEVLGNVMVYGNLRIGYEILWSADVNVAPLTVGTATCNCSPGKLVIGGGYAFNSAIANVVQSYPTGFGWVASGYNADLTTRTIRAYAICARLSP